jgi:Dolichyl-phosphate-mannose-protein mannosyltransferase
MQERVQDVAVERVGARGGRSDRLTVSRPGAPRIRLRSVLATLFPVREVVLPWFVSRVYSAVLITIAWSTGSAPDGGGIRWGGFGAFDGQWYLLIARDGYGPPPPAEVATHWPFFPVLPGVIRGLSSLGLDPQGAATVFNHLIFLLALAGLWRLARRHVSHRAAQLAVWSLALFPGAFIFSMVYPSAIFLAACVWAFLLAEERHDVLAGVVVAAAALARPNGIVLAVALLFAVRSLRRALVVCGPGVAALGVWCGLCWYWTGNPLVFVEAKEAWFEVTVIEFVKDPKLYVDVWPHLFLAVAAIAAVLICRRRLPGAWTALTLLYIVPSLGFGMIGLGRYATETFAPFVAAGEILRRTPTYVRVVAFSLAIAGQAVCVWLVLHYLYIP